MKLLTQSHLDQLAANGQVNWDLQSEDKNPVDFKPVVKLFTPDANATWLLTETSPKDPDVAFGLCDLGVGFPELGYVRISEIREVRGAIGLPVEHDPNFRPKGTLSYYADRAMHAGSIVP